MIKTFAGALLILAQSGAAQNQCIPRAQAGQMAVALVPSLIDSAARHCATHLPEGAFLGNGSRALSERLRADTAAIRAGAVTAILDMTGQAAPAEGQDPEQLIGVFADSMAEGLDAAKCRGASDLFEALAPLPTANFGQAFGAILGVLAAEAGEDGPPICPA